MDRVLKQRQTRTCIYPKDVCRITGKSERTSRRILQQVRTQNHKQKHQFITIKEFATWSGIDPDTIQSYLTS